MVICIITKEYEKIIKYQDLHVETQRMWNMMTTIVPITDGATVAIGRNLSYYLEKIPGYQKQSISAI